MFFHDRFIKNFVESSEIEKVVHSNIQYCKRYIEIEEKEHIQKV